MLNKGSVTAAVRKGTSRSTSYRHVPEWQEQAACVDYDPDLWFPEWPNANGYSKARHICGKCPVQIECATMALNERIPHGMFGRLTPGERQAILDGQIEPIPA